MARIIGIKNLRVHKLMDETTAPSSPKGQRKQFRSETRNLCECGKCRVCIKFESFKNQIINDTRFPVSVSEPLKKKIKRIYDELSDVRRGPKGKIRHISDRYIIWFMKAEDIKESRRRRQLLCKFFKISYKTFYVDLDKSIIWSQRNRPEIYLTSKTPGFLNEDTKRKEVSFTKEDARFYTREIEGTRTRQRRSPNVPPRTNSAASSSGQA